MKKSSSPRKDSGGAKNRHARRSMPSLEAEPTGLPDVLIRRIQINDYRTCLDTSFEPNNRLSVLIGPNGSGKTNVMQAISLLKQLSVPERSYGGAGEAPTADARLRVVFDVDQSGKRSLVELRAKLRFLTDEHNRDRVVPSAQNWNLTALGAKGSATAVPLFAVAGAPGGPLQHREWYLTRQYQFNLGRRLASFPPDLPTPAWEGLRAIGSFLGSLTYYAASQFTNPGNCPVSFEIEEGGGYVPPDQSRGSAAFLRDLYAAYKNPAQSSYKQFLDVVGPAGLHLIDGIAFNEIPTSSMSYTVRVGGGVREEQRKKQLIVPQLALGKQTLSPNQLSEGTFRTLTLIFYLLTGNSRLLLIEEPEVCVHHGLLASILELIKAHTKGRQVILSSHSEFVLDSMAPENVFSVSFTGAAGTVVKSIRARLSSSELAAMKEYLKTQGNLGEYWRHGGLEA